VPPAPEQGLQRQHAAAVAHPTVGSSLLRVTRLPPGRLVVPAAAPPTARLLRPRRWPVVIGLVEVERPATAGPRRRELCPGIAAGGQQFGDRSTGYAGPGTLPASGLGGAATQPWRPVRSARSPLQAIL
jgi:hypothetical protein